MTLRVALRCDGTNATGMGHICELLVLADALRRRGARPFVLTQNGTPGLRTVTDAGYPAVPLAFTPRTEDAAVAAALARERPDRVVVSMSGRPPAYYRGLRAASRHLTAVFDEGKARRSQADLVVDYCVRQRAKARPDELRGPRFGLFSPLLRRLSARRGSGPVKRLLINSGGSDPFDLTPRLVSAVRDLPGLRLEVVMGAAAAPALVKRVRAMRKALGPRLRLHIGLPAPRFIRLMASCDAAVTAAGNTLYELCALGVPSAVVSHHPRHQEAARAFAARGAAVDIGIGPVLSDAALARGLGAFLRDGAARRRLSRAASALVDPRGADRVAAAILAAKPRR